jgi:hypothetical protein
MTVGSAAGCKPFPARRTLHLFDLKLITPAKHGGVWGPPCPTSVLNSLLFQCKVYPSLA